MTAEFEYWLGRTCPECGVIIDAGSLRFEGYALAHKNPEVHPQAGHHAIRETMRSGENDDGE